MQAMKAMRYSLSMVQVKAGDGGVVGFISDALHTLLDKIKEFFTVKLPNAILGLVAWCLDQGMDILVTMVMSSEVMITVVALEGYAMPLNVTLIFLLHSYMLIRIMNLIYLMYFTRLVILADHPQVKDSLEGVVEALQNMDDLTEKMEAYNNRSLSDEDKKTAKQASRSSNAVFCTHRCTPMAGSVAQSMF